MLKVNNESAYSTMYLTTSAKSFKLKVFFIPKNTFFL